MKLCERGQDYAEIEAYIEHWLQRGVSYVVVGKALEWSSLPGMRRYPCQYFDNNFMVIRWDGRLVACAYHDRVVNEGLLPLGRVDASTPLLELYNNNAYTTLRARHREWAFPEPCDTCGFAYTGRGMVGRVRIRGRNTKPIYYHRDYYNSFYSYSQRFKHDEYYQQPAAKEA